MQTMGTSLSVSDSCIAQHTTSKSANRPSDKLILTSITDTGEENRRNQCLSYKQQQDGKEGERIRYYFITETDRQADRQREIQTERYGSSPSSLHEGQWPK